MKHIATVVIIISLFSAFCMQAALEDDFRKVPDSSKPWAYWWWLNGNVDKETITSDLEAMKRIGFGGLLMFDARGYWDDIDHVVLPSPATDFMSEEWQEMLNWGMTEAGRLGLKVSVNLSLCAGALKGPWPVGETAPKRLIWTALPLKSGETFNSRLLKPADRKHFRDIAALAVKYDGEKLEPMTEWLNAGDGPHDGWSGRSLGNTTQRSSRNVLDTVDLSDKMNVQDGPEWRVPQGEWVLLRFAYTTIDGHDFDVDMMDPSAVEDHFTRMGKRIINNAGHLAGKTLTHFYSVSWEGSVPTWTRDFESYFQKYRGYSIRPWLPVLAGFLVRGEQQTGRFMTDYRRTRNDVFRDNFYGTMMKLCHENGLQWHSESGGPWNRAPEIFGEADQLAFLARNDMPQGEFWYTGRENCEGRQLSRPQAMTAHTYGMKIAAAEAFTHMTRHWTPYPALLKRCADESFIDGVNHLIWHTFTCSPKKFGCPGSEYFAGTHINPNVTWFEQAAPFIEYLGRCQHMLREGLFVADLCVYTGDVPYQHWGRHTTEWSPGSTIKISSGHSYDIISTEVLLDRAVVKNGLIVLPDGMSYRVLAVDLDSTEVSLAALRRIEELKNSGAAVIFGERRPVKSYGMSSATTESDLEVQRLAEKLWADSPSIGEVLKSAEITPDFEGPFEFIHRRTRDAEIYFVAGTGKGKCLFRVNGKQPELWNPVTGDISDIKGWTESADGRTGITLDLPQHGSAFVVFRRTGMPVLAEEPAEHLKDIPLDGAWMVNFMPGRGAPAQAIFDPLIEWNTHADFGIRHFSGTATYYKNFDVPAEESASTAWLELGKVAALAEVKLNGHNLGIVWTAPWRIELTGALKEGENRLEIEVTNTWANRLTGDCHLPPEKRITRSNMQYQSGKRTLKAFQGFASTDPLQSGGLAGPVKISFYGINKVQPLR